MFMKDLWLSDFRRLSPDVDFSYILGNFRENGPSFRFWTFWAKSPKSPKKSQKSPKGIGTFTDAARPLDIHDNIPRLRYSTRFDSGKYASRVSFSPVFNEEILGTSACSGSPLAFSSQPSESIDTLSIVTRHASRTRYIWDIHRSTAFAAFL